MNLNEVNDMFKLNYKSVFLLIKIGFLGLFLAWIVETFASKGVIGIVLVMLALAIISMWRQKEFLKDFIDQNNSMIQAHFFGKPLNDDVWDDEEYEEFIQKHTLLRWRNIFFKRWKRK